MNTTITRLLIGIALTAGITYLLDPTSGRSRRDAMRKQVGKAAQKLNDGTRAARTGLADRALRLAGECRTQATSFVGHAKSLAGSVAGQARSFVRPDPMRDDIVAARAHAALRRNLSDSSAAITTVNRPKEMLAWHSEPGSAVEHAGVIRFERLGPDQTRLHVNLSYSPPAGALGHYAAKLFGADAGSELDQELRRTKCFAETFRSSADFEVGGDADPSGARSRRRRAKPEHEESGAHGLTSQSKPSL